MIRQLLATTALVAGLSVAAWAEDAAQQPSGDATVAPAAAPQSDPAAPLDESTAAPQDQDAAAAAPETEAPEGDTAAAPEEPAAPEADTAAAPAPAEPADSTAVGRATPGEGLIAAQPDSHSRAAEIIGLTVMSAEGDEIGEVDDLIFDDQQKLSGLVVGVGGFLGIGEKAVGIDWSQAEMRSDPETGTQRIVVGLTKADLEAAPDFKTKEQAMSEAAAAAEQSQVEQPAPAAGSETTQ